MTTSRQKVKYLIIGNSAGGIGAAEAIREADKKGTITIVSDEPYPAYSRVLISNYLAEGLPLGRMLFRSADFYKKNNIQTFLGNRIKQLDVSKHTAKLEGGEILSWEKLLLATGAAPTKPQIKGGDLEGAFTFNTLDDAKAIDQLLKQYPKGTARAVIVGAGLVSVSLAEALVKREVRVIMVVRSRIMRAILDDEISVLEEKTLKQAGVEIIAGRTVTRLNSYSGDAITSATLDDSRPIPCEMVVFAMGVQPRTELVSASGIKINQGIVVDHHMATSNPDVYACGDNAEAYDFVYGENKLTAGWPNAFLGGRVAGSNMAGVPKEYRSGTRMNTLKYFGLNIVSAGMVIPPDDGYQIISRKHGNTYRKLVLKDGVIVGMIFADRIESSGIILSLMRNKENVSDFKEALVADDFGLASLPEKIWRSQLKIPPAASSSGISEKRAEKVLVKG